MGKRRYMKIKDSCVVKQTIKKGVRTFKCQNLKRSPSAQEVIDSVKLNKIKRR